MARTTAASEYGYELHIDEQSDGTWRWSLHNETGEVAHGIRGSHSSGYDGARAWLRKNHPSESPTELPGIAPVRPKPKPRPGPAARPTGPGTSQLVSILEDRARYGEEEAVRLRERADVLETEAKRLWAAADVLKDPDNGTET